MTITLKEKVIFTTCSSFFVAIILIILSKTICKNTSSHLFIGWISFTCGSILYWIGDWIKNRNKE